MSNKYEKKVYSFIRHTTKDFYFLRLKEELSKLSIKVRYSDQRPTIFPLSFNLKRFNSKIIHLHWLYTAGFDSRNLIQLLFNYISFIIDILFLKYIFKVKIVWTVHNLFFHETYNKKLEKIGKLLFCKLVDRIIVHCETAKNRVIKSFKVSSRKVHIIPHGNYINCYENDVKKKKARKILNLKETDFVFLFFGRIRPYKGIDELINSFNILNKNTDSKLLIVGKPFTRKLKDYIIDKAENNDIKYEFGRVKDKNIQIYMNASDIVVAPYQKILTSGLILLAMTFKKPIIAPSIGCIQDVLDQNGAFLYSPINRNSLLEMMKKATKNKHELTMMGLYNFKRSKIYDWGKLAKKIKSVYLN